MGSWTGDLWSMDLQQTGRIVILGSLAEQAMRLLLRKLLCAMFGPKESHGCVFGLRARVLAPVHCEGCHISPLADVDCLRKLDLHASSHSSAGSYDERLARALPPGFLRQRSTNSHGPGAMASPWLGL